MDSLPISYGGVVRMGLSENDKGLKRLGIEVLFSVGLSGSRLNFVAGPPWRAGLLWQKINFAKESQERNKRTGADFLIYS